MNKQQLVSYLQHFCEATNCRIQEKTDSHLTVRLAPDVDRALTNRPYYWLFVDRTGVEAEPLQMRWVFDRQKIETLSTLQRLPELTCQFGTQGLQQIFRVCQEKGRFIRLFEHPDEHTSPTRGSRTHHTWVCFNVKVEFCCDLKQEHWLSLGVHLQTGKIKENFYPQLLNQSELIKRLKAELPRQTHLARELFTVEQAWQQALQHINRWLETQDHKWADEARYRLQAEHEQHEAYVHQLTEEARALHLYEKRVEEINRQYEPCIHITPLSFALFHLSPASNISTAV